MARPDRKPRRAHQKARCRSCGLHLDLCLCAGLPVVRTPFDVLIIQHFVEEHRPTNTGRLIARMLPRSRLVQYGRPDQPLDRALFGEPGRRHILLFPRYGSRELTKEDLVPADGTPVTLVVPDGNWRQASRMSRRNAILQEMPCLALPAGRPGAWTIRNSRRQERLCTAEAVIRTVDLAGMHEEAALMHEKMVAVNNAIIAMRPRHTGVVAASALPT